jgi:hypothetical protein
MKKLLPDGRSYRNRLPGTVKVRPITYAITKLDYSSWRLRGQRSCIRRGGSPVPQHKRQMLVDGRRE